MGHGGILSALVAVLLAALSALPEKRVTPSDWMPLIRNGDYANARSACEAWLRSADAGSRAEAHKCLANVELAEAGAAKLRIEVDRSDGGFLGQGYAEAPARRASEHLNQAVLLIPQDLTIHQGRLHVLMLAGLYDEMTRALEQSVKLYRGPDPLGAWLAYPAELHERRQFERAIDLLLLLDKAYPSDHRVAGNLSAAYAMLGNDSEALAWAKRAVKLAPEDPIDTWNLARIYDYTGEVALADTMYRRSLGIQRGKQKAESMCTYAEFVSTKMKEPKRACALQREAGCATPDCSPL